MKASDELKHRLNDWAARNEVQLEWGGEIIGLLDGTGRRRAVITIPAEFWPKFEELDAFDRESVIGGIVLNADLQYDPDWEGMDAKDITIPISYVLNRK